VKAPKTSGGGRTQVRHTIPLGIVIFLVKRDMHCIASHIVKSGHENIMNKLVAYLQAYCVVA